MTINNELKIYDDAFKNYLWVKVFDDNVFASLKVTVFFIRFCVLKWSHLGVKISLGHSQIGLL